MSSANGKRKEKNASTSSTASISPAKKKTKATSTNKSQSNTSSTSTSSFPAKISKGWTVLQLKEEAAARRMYLGNSKLDKTFLLTALGEGSVSVLALQKKQQKATASKKKPKASSVSSPANSKLTTIKKADATKAKFPTPVVKKKSSPSDTIAPYNKNKPLVKAASKVALSKKNTKIQVNTKPKASLKAPPASVAAARPDTVPSSTTAAKIVSSPKQPQEDDYPRISNKMSIQELKEEAAARQLDLKKIPKLKADLLHYLVDNSIHVKESKEYKSYQALLNRIQDESGKLYQESLAKKQAAEAKREERDAKRYEKEQLKRQQEEKERLERRQVEKEKQKSLHTHSFPQVHVHPLAKSNTLQVMGAPRRGKCDICGRLQHAHSFFAFSHPKPTEYTCEKCDWDVCYECFVAENKPEEEKKKIRRKAEKKIQAEERKREAEQCRREEEYRNRWDAKKRFKDNIQKPPAKNKQVSSNLKYTVWCSDGYEPDGWHSYQGEPDKEFDSSWTTKKEANERAEYLFFWKNPWGIDPEDVSDDYEGDPTPTAADGMKKWSVAPTDSTRWTVGVVPSEVFPHLENACQHCHNYDDM